MRTNTYTFTCYTYFTKNTELCTAISVAICQLNEGVPRSFQTHS